MRLTKNEKFLLKFDSGIRPCNHQACKDMLTMWDKGVCVVDMIREKNRRKS